MSRHVIAANGSDSIDVSGRFVYIKSATGEVRLRCTFQDGSIQEEDMEAQDQLEFDKPLRSITLYDLSGASNTVVMKVSEMLFHPRRDGGSITVTGTAAVSSVDLGVKADAVATTDTGTFSLIALAKRLLSKIPGVGQAAMAASLPVVIASNQTAVAVSGPVTDTELRASDVGVTAHAGATGGADRQRIITTASTNGGFAKASPGKIYAINGTNTSAVTLFLKLYNMTTAPTVGTDVPVETYALPVGAFSFEFADVGVNFSTGIAYAITGGIADADTTNTAANDVVMQLHFK